VDSSPLDRLSDGVPEGDPDGVEPTAERPDERPVEHGDDPPPGYRVRLDVFEGPFDLLLRLIGQRKLDLYDVDLAEITADFLSYLRLEDLESSEGIGGLDLETATHFLVVAATLIELKAVRLLPTESETDYDELLSEARDLLYARLLEYRAFREASTVLAHLLEAHADLHGRDVPLEPRFRDVVPPFDGMIDPEELASIASRACRPREKPHVRTDHIHRAVLSVRDAAERVLGLFEAAGAKASYREIVAHLPRPERVVHFLAVLELYKLGIVDLEQTDRFGDVVLLRRRAGGEGLRTLEEYATAPESATETR
jgi:segregation and condensation protein A